MRSRSGRSVLPTRWASRPSRSTPYEDRNSSHRLKADESYQIGETGHPVRAYLSVDEIIRVAKHAGADAVYPGYGFLSENPELAAACAEAGITFVGPGAHVLELTGNKARAIAAAREAGSAGAGVVGAVGVGGRARRRRGGHAVPAVRQGRVRRRRARHAAGGRPRCARRGDRGRQPRGRVGVRRSDGLPRAGGAQPASHRGADPRRRAGQRHPPVRARLQRAAPPPEGDRARARAEPARRAAGQDLRRRGRVRAADRLHLRGHRRVPARRARPSRVHRDEPAHPGRAHRHRGDHRRRPGGQPAAHRRGGDAGRSRPEPGHGAGARCRDAVPDHHRGPGQRIPARHRPDHRLPLPGRRGHPPRRRHEPRRRDRRALRLDAGQDDVPRPRLLDRGDARPPRVGGVPHPRRVDEHPVPAGGRRRPRLPGGPGHDVVHRRAAAAAHRAHPRRPRHEDPQLPGRRHGQHAVRASGRDGSTRRTSCPTFDLSSRRRRRAAGSG